MYSWIFCILGQLAVIYMETRTEKMWVSSQSLYICGVSEIQPVPCLTLIFGESIKYNQCLKNRNMFQWKIIWKNYISISWIPGNES